MLEDFQKGFLRRLGNIQDEADGTTVSGNKDPADIGVDIVSGSTYVELKYFRLSHSRALKEAYRFSIWQAQTFLGEMPPSTTNAAKGHKDYGNLVAMEPVGKDHV